MITKYNNYIKESLSTKTEIKKWLDKMDIENYTIKHDLTVDVDGDVNISNKNLTEIPVRFNNINGNFYCYHNKLTNLEGCPTIVNGNFDCSSNKLISLEGCPTTVNGNFYCYHNKLTNLEGCPTIVNGNFDCSSNNLTSLKGCPTNVDGYFNCPHNPNLVDINDLDSKILIKSITFIKVSEEVSQELYDKYFEHWIDKDFNIFKVLKDKVSDNIKQKYDYLFQANNFNLL